MRIALSGEPPVDLRRVRGAIRKALHPFGLPRETVVGLAFIDDDAMRVLNKRHRKKDKTTDVLSFGQDLPERAKGEDAIAVLERDADGTLSLGDIVISAAQARRQARARKTTLAREIAFLAAHGALHLVGFEDETHDGYRDMVHRGEAAVSAAWRRTR